jgi:hypothetical protein
MFLIKKTTHGGYVSYVPTTDVLVESGLGEHIVHGGNFGHIPTTDVLAESSTMESEVLSRFFVLINKPYLTAVPDSEESVLFGVLSFSHSFWCVNC